MMTLHRLGNAALLTAFLALVSCMQQLDTDPDQELADDHTAAQAHAVAEWRELHARASVCIRTAGPGTEPAELPDGTYVCRDKSGHLREPSRAVTTVVATR